MTATPCRLNGDSLGNIYDNLIVGVESEYLIENGYLCEYDYYAPKINYILPNIKGNDYDVSQIEWKSQIYGDVLKYIDPNRKIIIYCPNIKFSLELEQQLPNARHFDGNTSKEERKQIINDFREGKIRILLNVDLIGEGFDVPDCDCVILLRPTQSLVLYIQQSMRCLRPNENKKAIIYDFVGNVYRHGMPTEKHEWFLNKKVKCKNSNSEPDIITRECKKCYRVYSGTNPICPYCNNHNGKTKKQIEQDKEAELEKIKKVERRQQGMCRDLTSLIELGKQRGYKNPRWWAEQILKSRNKGGNI